VSINYQDTVLLNILARRPSIVLTRASVERKGYPGHGKLDTVPLKKDMRILCLLITWILFFLIY
jgi:hypothetical protein